MNTAKASEQTLKFGSARELTVNLEFYVGRVSVEYKEVDNSVCSVGTEKQNKTPKTSGLLCFKGIDMGPVSHSACCDTALEIM